MNTIANFTQNIAANQSQFSFRVQGQSDDCFQVASFSSSSPDALFGHYNLSVSLRAAELLNPADMVGQEATLELGPEGPPIHGIITSFSGNGSGPNGFSFSAELASPLYLLTLSRGNKVFLQKNVLEIIEAILSATDLGGTTYSIEASGKYPAREYVLQYDESDYDFLTRIMAKNGLFFRIEQGNKARVLIHDRSENLPAQAGGALQFQLLSGSTRDKATIFAFLPSATLQPGQVEMRDYNYRTPETTITGFGEAQSKLPGSGEQYCFAEHAKSMEESSSLAKLRMASFDWQRQTYWAESDCRSACAGTVLTMEGYQDDSALNGDYLIVAVDHQGAQNSAFALGGSQQSMTYRNKLLLIRTDLPFQPPVAAPRRISGPITARIESTGGDYAYLDEQGRYRLRLDLDRGDQAKGEASHPVRLLQPYSGEDYGCHFPLHAGAEVIISCVNGDPDRPVILGMLTNSENPSPVTSRKAYENILRTWGGNELLMDDCQDREKIQLFTKERKNLLSLDADNQQHQIRLISEEGKLSATAAQTLLFKSDGSHTLKGGNDHLITVENSQQLVTRKGALGISTGTDIRLTAGDNILLQAEEENLTMTADQDIILEVGEGMDLEVSNNDLELTVSQGQLSISAANKLNIMGQGQDAITISQGGASIEIAASGDITINATTCDINGDIAMDGSNSNQGGSASAVAPATGGGTAINSTTSSSDSSQKTDSAATAELTTEPQKVKPREATPPVAEADKTNTALEQPLRKVLACEVTGPSSGKVGEELTYTVTQFNLADATEAEKKQVNWLIKCDGKEKAKYQQQGAIIKYKVATEQMGKTLYVFAYINSASPNVMVKTQIEGDLKEVLRKKLEEYEGRINHMYLDSNGYVTIGVGHLITDEANAYKIKLVNGNSDKATNDDIYNDFNGVNTQVKGMRSIYYKKFTKLTIDESEIDMLTNEHIDSFEKELKIIYPEFESYPRNAKLALFDMIFNLGMTNLNAKWPEFNKYVKSRKWKSAALTSKRSSPVSESRNNYVRDLFNGIKE